MAQSNIEPTNHKAESFKLLSGRTIPAVGLGTWKSGDEAFKSVFTAIVEVLSHFISYFAHITL